MISLHRKRCRQHLVHTNASSRILDIQELPRSFASSSLHHLFIAAFFDFDDLADERGNHVRRTRVEVIPRPVQVHGQ